MHSLEFEDNTFDIIVIGWVLGYSTRPSDAIREIVRVAKPDSLIAIGWDPHVPSTLSSSGDHLFEIDESYHYTTADSILGLFKDVQIDVSKVHLSIDPSPPYCHETKRGFLVISPNKRIYPAFSWNSLLEAEAAQRVLQAYEGIRQQEQGSEGYERTIYRINSHREQAIHGFTEKSHDLQAYLIMRQQRCSMDDVTDNVIHNSIKMNFPWSLDAFLSASYPGFSPIFDFDKSTINQAKSNLEEEGFFVFPDLLPAHIVDRLNKVFDEFVTESHSGRLIVNDPLINSREVQEIAFSLELLSIAGEWLQCMPIFNGVSAMVTNPTVAATQEELIQKVSGDAQLLHHDKDRIRWINFFLYLSDVPSEEWGAHVVYSATNKVGAIRDNRIFESEIGGFYGPEAYTNKRVILGQQGTLFAVDTSNLHRGSPVQFGQRRVLEVTFAASLFGATNVKLDMASLVPKFKVPLGKFPRIFERFL
jgi:hypothetical protein